MLLELLELVDQHQGGHQGGDGVGYRDADPDAQRAEETRKHNQAGYQEEQLPRERKEDRLL